MISVKKFENFSSAIVLHPKNSGSTAGFDPPLRRTGRGAAVALFFYDTLIAAFLQEEQKEKLKPELRVKSGELRFGVSAARTQFYIVRCRAG